MQDSGTQYGVIGFFVLSALAVGAYSGITYQKHLDAPLFAEKNTSLSNKDISIAELQNKLTQALEKIDSEQRIRAQSELGGPSPDTVAPPLPRNIPAVSQFTAPKNGSRLCRNTNFIFTWRADAVRVDQIRILLDTSVMPTAPIADAPVSWNEESIVGKGTVDWKVGTNTFGSQTMDLPDGELYRIRLEALKDGNLIETRKVGPFAIDTCQG